MPSWQERIKRAEELAAQYSFAAEVLHFYGQITGFQETFYAQIAAADRDRKGSASGGSLWREPDFSFLLPGFRRLLSLVEQVGPPALAREAGDLKAQGEEEWSQILANYWRGTEPAAAEAAYGDLFFARAFLQPYAEYLRHQVPVQSSGYHYSLCPVCSRKPSLGVLRPEGDGAKRSLICSFCLAEWDYRRLLCPGCGEEDNGKLPVYTAEEFKHVRVESCDTCKKYIKTVDLTKNGLAVPVVDEIGAAPLDLWARDHGYSKLELNLVGM